MEKAMVCPAYKQQAILSQESWSKPLFFIIFFSNFFFFFSFKFFYLFFPFRTQNLLGWLTCQTALTSRVQTKTWIPSSRLSSMCLGEPTIVREKMLKKWTCGWRPSGESFRFPIQFFISLSSLPFPSFQNDQKCFTFSPCYSCFLFFSF
jgi:hypothetical protein